MKRRVIIATGGTGGHLFPAEQLSEMLSTDFEILFAGHGLGANPFFSKERKNFVEVLAHPLKKGFIKASWKGFWQSIRLIRHFDPDIIVGFGSFHTFPILLAACILRKKLVLFEANCVLGKVNRLFSLAADQVASQWELPLKKAVLVPPLPWTAKVRGALKAQEARAQYGLDPNCETILIFGGSQGAAFLNESVPEVIAKWKKGVQVIHLTGCAEETVRKRYAELGVRAAVKAFEKDMQLAYSAATIAICRSGASTLGELLKFSVPALLIPYPYATEDHQKKNADYFSQLGGSIVLMQKEANAERMIEAFEKLFSCLLERKRSLSRAFQKTQERAHLAEWIRVC